MLIVCYYNDCCYEIYFSILFCTLRKAKAFYKKYNVPLAVKVTTIQFTILFRNLQIKNAK